MRKTLRLQQSHSIRDTEASLQELQRASECDLLLNLQLHDWQFGGIASLIQLLITWRKRNPTSRLVTHIQDKSRAVVQLRNLAQTDHGLVALMLAADITTANRSTSVASEAALFVRTRLDEMRTGTWPPSPERLLVCADYNNYYLPQFYYEASRDDPRPRIKPEGEFAGLTLKLISKMITVHYRAKPLPLRFTDALGTILYELFSNTERWAKDEWDRMPIERSIRGLRLEMIRGKKERLFSQVKGNQPLEQYLATLSKKTSAGEQILVEVSVFDSGPGLASRWLETPITVDLSLEAERKAVMECLKRHATSEPKSHHGLGLYFVMRQLTSVGGFIRVRTGRLHLYRDFVNRPFVPQRINASAYSNTDPELFSWQSGINTAQTNAQVEGTLFTMLIPLRIESV
jgi:hypothetical protein